MGIKLVITKCDECGCSMVVREGIYKGQFCVLTLCEVCSGHPMDLNYTKGDEHPYDVIGVNVNQIIF